MVRTLALLLLGAAAAAIRLRPAGIAGGALIWRRAPVSVAAAVFFGWAVSLLEVATGFAAAVAYPVSIGIALAIAAIAAAIAGELVEHPPDLRSGLRAAPRILNRHRSDGTALSLALSRSDVAALAITAGALAIRLWNLPNLGYSHWDEAFFVGDAERVASSIRAGWNTLGWFAPPGHSIALGLVFRAFGIYPWAAFALSAVWGSLMVLTCYLFGRDAFSPLEGLLAAAFCATSEFAVMYSRMALSDAMFGFFFVLSLYLLWRALEGRGRWSLLAAGIAVGILINTKYDGPIVLVIAPAYVALNWLNRLARGPRLGWRGEALWVLVRAGRYLVAAVVAALLTVPFMLHVERVAGFSAFWHQFGGYSVSSGTLVKTPISTMALYFTAFGSALLLAAAVLGLLVAAIRRREGDILLFVATIAFLGVLQLYLPYPRLALPLLPLAALLAGSGLGWLLSHARRLGSARQTALAVVAAAIVIVPQAAALPSLLALQTTGYRSAAGFAAAHPGATVFTHLQPVAYLYADAGVPFDGSQRTRHLLDRGGDIYLVADHTLYWSADTTDFMKANAGRLEVVERIPNPLPPEVLLQPAYPDAFDRLRSEPDVNRYIYVYRLTGRPVIPPSWAG